MHLMQMNATVVLQQSLGRWNLNVDVEMCLLAAPVTVLASMTATKAGTAVVVTHKSEPRHALNPCWQQSNKLHRHI